MALKPTLSIPTGYESIQRAAASKRKLADAMLERGLAPEAGMNNWAQVLGHWAQAWAGKSMQKDADKMDADVSNQIREAYTTKRAAFLQDSQTLNPQQLVQKYGNEPLLRDDLKPYAEAFASGLKDQGELTNFGGRMVRKGDVAGQYANDPNKMVFVGPDGQTSLNPVAVAAAGLSSGNLTPKGDYQTTGQMPGTQRLVGAMSGQLQTQQPAPITSEQGGTILGNAARTSVMSAEEAMKVHQSMGPNGQSAFLKWVQDNGIRVKVTDPAQARQLPSGTLLMLPDGTEGRVP